VRATSLPASPEAEAAVVSFLDCHPPSSVLYISFGSQNSIRAEHMTELALALESAGRPFVWAVRPPVGHDVKGDFRADQWLPDGFEEKARRGKRGLLLRGWAPQVRILAHASTGAFLSHCGWNSVLESVTHGVPILGWPLSSEQFYNAKMLNEEWGVCMEVARGKVEDTVVSRAAVADVVETVMGQTAKAAEMRRRLREIKEVMEVSWKEGSGSSRKAVEDFLQAMNLR
jgi:UDP:flavonoid glycosyltransferase YjiC (YdhE family)